MGPKDCKLYTFCTDRLSLDTVANTPRDKRMLLLFSVQA